MHSAKETGSEMRSAKENLEIIEKLKDRCSLFNQRLIELKSHRASAAGGRSALDEQARQELRNTLNGEHEFTLMLLSPEHLPEIFSLQREIVESIDDQNWFVASTEEELLENMEHDFCLGLFDEDVLAAMCVIIKNRDTELSLFTELPLSYSDCITFDTIQVKPEYRGHGIQSFFLGVADEIAEIQGVPYIAASVSPYNEFSRRNFLEHGYSVVMSKKMYKCEYKGKERDIVVKETGGEKAAG